VFWGLKRTVHPKIKVLSLTCPHFVPNPYCTLKIHERYIFEEHPYLTT